MTDSRLVRPQRVEAVEAATGSCAPHRYWCWKRITGASLLGAAVLGLVWWAVR
ncbi:hypothetical protein GCM10028801_15080 [Nocardioides maradonensis]